MHVWLALRSQLHRKVSSWFWGLGPVSALSLVLTANALILILVKYWSAVTSFCTLNGFALLLSSLSCCSCINIPHCYLCLSSAPPWNIKAFLLWHLQQVQANNSSLNVSPASNNHHVVRVLILNIAAMSSYSSSDKEQQQKKCSGEIP